MRCGNSPWLGCPSNIVYTLLRIGLPIGFRRVDFVLAFAASGVGTLLSRMLRLGSSWSNLPFHHGESAVDLVNQRAQFFPKSTQRTDRVAIRLIHPILRICPAAVHDTLRLLAGSLQQSALVEDFQSPAVCILYNPVGSRFGLRENTIAFSYRLLALTDGTGHIDAHSVEKLFDLVSTNHAIGSERNLPPLIDEFCQFIDEL